ncbi:DUF4394 domain-containing protein [Rhizobium sp. AAP43]|uniref:DUF4394 domain-containing protein n=1 Tax=Rhizobium sp. AAP43 TaxID=1523420 RepID=UPI0006B98DB0|nr:DUF4394 domain-containing protein [Rhizobium sp. AAP43]KPF41313.1 hypothetical protein IP76_21565 [Rhizobium sp. AAP43]
MTAIRISTLLAATMLAATGAQAAQVLGLAGDKTLVMFDTDKPDAATSVEITGVDRLVGLDFRPADKSIVGVTAGSVIVRIDAKTGAATEVAKMDIPLTIGDAPVVVNFNPAADRLRFMTGTTNHRVHPDTGAVTVDGSLAFEEGDMHKGEMPNIVAAAYTNSTGKPEKTAMYNIDATIGALIQQTKPNDGTLKAIGKLGIETMAKTYAFDIQATGEGKNTAWLVADNALYTVNLETGAATKAGTIGGIDMPIKSITVMPAM